MFQPTGMHASETPILTHQVLGHYVHILRKALNLDRVVPGDKLLLASNRDRVLNHSLEIRRLLEDHGLVAVHPKSVCS